VNYFEAGYFDAPAITKPLLHLWSLGVEEQFYFVYPVLLVALWRYSAGRSVLALIGIASFALNVSMVHNHPSFTFYLPLTRFWEFIVGASLARTPIRGRNVNTPALFGSWERPGFNVTAPPPPADAPAPALPEMMTPG
jgi:peptidoglycan/LPS O-acetylase OafA/YrhL